MAATFTNPLDSIKVASPCPANWDEMIGNNRERFCGECKLNVYNLSGMTRKEAENLIINSEGRLCARFFRRADGTIITKDCPVGWRAVKRRMSKVWTAFASLIITAIGGIGITSFVNQKAEPEVMGIVAIENPQPETGEILFEPDKEPELIMGDIAMPAANENEAIMGKISLPRE